MKGGKQRMRIGEREEEELFMSLIVIVMCIT